MTYKAISNKSIGSDILENIVIFVSGYHSMEYKNRIAE